MTTATQPAFTADFAIGYRAMMLPAIAHERVTTRKVFAAIPDKNHDYRPDPNSRTALELATHLAESDVWFLSSIADLKFNFDPSGQLPAFKSGAAVNEWYDANFQAAYDRVDKMTPQQLLTPVDFFGMMTMPVFTYLLFANNHHVHHRAQISTYLRAMGGKVPNIYGGSFDEPMF